MAGSTFEGSSPSVQAGALEGRRIRKTFGGVTAPLFKMTQNIYRSHNCIHEEMPLLWDFAKHYSSEVDANNNVTRYYSESGFKVPGDKVRIYP